MYNNYMPNMYQAPYGPNRQEIVHVNGENGARAYQLPPNSNILLLDDNAPIVWLCQTDGAGYKTVTPYTITPYKPEPEIDLKALENRIAKLEKEIKHESNTSDATTETYE